MNDNNTSFSLLYVITPEERTAEKRAKRRMRRSGGSLGMQRTAGIESH